MMRGSGLGTHPIWNGQPDFRVVMGEALRHEYIHLKVVNGPSYGKPQHEKLGVGVFYGGATNSGKLSVHYVHILLLVDIHYREGWTSQPYSNPFHHFAYPQMRAG